MATLALALGLLLWPRAGAVEAMPARAARRPCSRPLKTAEESVRRPARPAARKENDPKLKELVQKLTETIQEMKLPGVDTKEALAKLSEMQAAIAAQQAAVQRRAGRCPDAGTWTRRWPRPRPSKGPARP